MSNLTPIQEAICAVIRDSGIDGLKSCYVSELSLSHEPVIFHDSIIERTRISGEWRVTVDGHEVTQKEYEQWEKRNDLKSCED